MTTYTLSRIWAYALNHSRNIPQNLGPQELHNWLIQYVPPKAKEYNANTAFCTQIDPEYPSSLLGSGAPFVLFYKGNINLLKKTKIAVVGTRKCSTVGAEYAKKISIFLHKHDIISVSGLAYGIDEVVHSYAPSKTIGVMPCGFGAKLPHRTQKLCDQIIREGGLLLSEFPPYSPPRKWRFIQRNRIIAWLGDALILAEAPAQSGALHTVDFALQRDKKIWIVPSSPLTHSNHGGLQLIASGFDSLCDLAQLAHYLKIPYNSENLHTIMSFSELANHLNMNTKQTIQEISRLEIDGKITALPNGYFSWNPYC